MSANRIFLVCAHHPSIDEALLIADRQDSASQYTAAMPKRADEWFAKHQRCAPGADHFKIAYHRPLDHDAPTPQTGLTPASAGVKLAIVSSRHDQLSGPGQYPQDQLNGSKPR